MKYVILKVDTTGLNPADADVVHISAVRVDGDKKTTFERFVNPGYHIPEEASKISGIYDKDVYGHPCFKDIKDSFLEFIGDAPIIGHNIDFELSFLNKYLNTPISNKSMSLMNMARHFGYNGSLKFLAMCKHYGAPYYMHYNTAEITNILFQCMLEEHKNAIEKKDNSDA